MPQGGTFSDGRMVHYPMAGSTRLKVVFPHDGDGFQPITSVVEDSVFKLPRFAPETGYQSELVQGFVDNGENHPQNLFFRIRTEKDDAGHIVKAMYGKISGPIGFGGVASAQGTRSLTYYLNPDNTRNLEFDTINNLFLDEGIYEP